MKQNERDIQRKLRILRYAEEVGSAVKACRYFGIGRVGKQARYFSEGLLRAPH